MPAGRPLKILVIGCGSIGRRHIRLLKEIGVEVSGYDVDPNTRQKTITDLGIQVFENLDDMWDSDPAGVIVATPNHLHLRSVREAFAQVDQRGYLTIRGALIEKPLAADERTGQELLFATTADGKVQTPVLVGYCLRFHPGLQRLKRIIDEGTIGAVRHATIHFGSYLPGWRPGTDYRTNYAASKEHGGGILLDASHELDYACWLFGEPESVMCQMQNTGALEIETEDVADLVVRFQSGVQANIHLDYLSRRYRRGCTITGDNGNVVWYTEPGYSSLVLHLPELTCAPAIWDMDSADDLYRSELQHFLRVIRGEETPLVTGEDGLRVLRVVEAAKRSAETGKVVLL